MTTWLENAAGSFSRVSDAIEDGRLKNDAYVNLQVLWNHRNAVFKKTLGHAERSYVSELREVRNKWAHQEPFTYDDTYRALDTMSRLLKAVSAFEADELSKLAQETMRTRFAEQARAEVRRKSVQAIEGSPQAGLKPWREVVTPHPDVATGRYSQAEFAADLEQVHSGKAAAEYGDAQRTPYFGAFPVQYYHRQHAEYCGHCRHEHRAQPFRARLGNGFKKRHVAFSQQVDIIHQHNGVVDHHAHEHDKRQ